MALRYPGLTLRGGTHIVRMGVPADVRAVIGKHELIRSLQTGDLGEARRAHGEVYAEFKKIIADARNGTTTVRITVDPQAATIALAYWSNLKLAEDVPAEGDPQTPWPVAEMIGAWEKAVITPDGWRAISGFDGIVSEMLTLGGMPVAPTDPNVAAIRRVAAMNKLFALKHHEKARIEAVHLARAAAIRSVDLDEMVVTTTPERALGARCYWPSDAGVIWTTRGCRPGHLIDAHPSVPLPLVPIAC